MTWPWPRVCVFWWTLAVLVVALVVSRPNKGGRLYPTFVLAGEHFWYAEPLYGPVPDHLDQFRYSPLAAMLFSPWHHLSPTWGQVLWRALQAIAYLWALRSWANGTAPPVRWPILALLTLPLVLGNIFNAQINLLVGGLLLFATMGLAQRRFWFVAVALTLATMFKIYPLAVGLLFVLLEPRLAPRLAFTLLVAGLLPYLFHDAHYINQQFADWLTRLNADDRTHWPLESGYHDAHKLLRRWGLTIPLEAYRLIEVGVGLTFAAWVWKIRRTPHALHTAFVLGSLWCTLFGPATETPTYMLLAAVLVQSLLTAHEYGPWSKRCLIVVYVLMLSVPISYWFPAHLSNPYRTLIPQAHAALLFLGWFVATRSRAVGHQSTST